MSKDLEKAKKILSDGYTCVLCKGDEVLTSNQRGVKPLLDFLDSQKDFSGFVSADKVIGKGAAFLYVLMNIKSVYAVVISEMAAEVFKEYGVDYTASSIVPAIKNRQGDGFCPIESTLIDINEPYEALDKIKETIKNFI